jgi:hypothetical protein
MKKFSVHDLDYNPLYKFILEIYVMQRLKFQLILLPLSLLIVWTFSASSLTDVQAQEPQASPTSAASQTGIFITVLGDEPFANIRVGPSASIYPVIGQLLPGDTAPALGRSPGGDWIQIEFSGAPNNRGWIYSPLVLLSPGTLPIAEPPPTPIPPATSTIDPTLAAQFTNLVTNTRLPTFTPPAPLMTAVYTEEIPVETKSNSIPMAIVILSLGGFGVVGFILSLFLPRRFS